MIGDIFHFILECQALQHFREQFVSRFGQTNHNTDKLYNIFTTHNIDNLNRICKYIIEASELIQYFKHFILLFS